MKKIFNKNVTFLRTKFVLLTLRMKKHLFLPTLLVFFSFTNSFSDSVVAINDSINQYEVAFSKLDIFEDKTSALTISDVSSDAYKYKFKENKVQLPRNYNKNSAYWLRFKILNNSNRNKFWLFEYFDSSIQQIVFFAPDSKGGFNEFAAGNHLSFDNKYIFHKNFVFPISPIIGDEQIYYARIKSSHLVFMLGVVRSYERFTSYALYEYYFLGVFYGIILAMAIYNLLLFVTVKDRTYLYYVLYVLSSGFLCSVLDGTGFHFVWPNYPQFNQNAFSLSMFLMSVWALMYTQGFVSLKTATKFHFNILELFIILRMLVFIIAQAFFPSLRELVIIDIIVLLICYVSGIISYKSGNTSTKYFVIGFTLLFIGFIVSNLTINSILGITLPNNIYTVYSFNVGIILEMILLSYALADKIKVVMREHHDTQASLILQLKEKDELRDVLNKELEQKVIARTSELSKKTVLLEEKNSELSRLYEEVKDNIKVAKWIQESILPPDSLIKKHLPHNFVYYKPKDVVSGDFYWFYAKGSKKYIAAVDCTGHGVAGAFMSIIGYDMLNQIVRNPENEHLNAAQILDKLNEGVIETLRQKQRDAKTRDGMDINLCIFDTKTNIVNYSGAVNYLYIVRDKELIKLVADSFSIGIPKMGDIKQFTNHEYQLVSGDLVIQYSDGYADQLGGKDGYKKFLYPRFRDMILEMSDKPISQYYGILDKNFVEWMGNWEQTDDILVIGTKII
ncbi:MAG: hypothetical protein EAZ53_06660 [Bacteroidetes bacterium]|nr:MAG: hypothetical protein EAZ53_06660 [Bacteroidota bacterium]